MDAVSADVSAVNRLVGLLPARDLCDWLRRSIPVWQDVCQAGFVSMVTPNRELIGFAFEDQAAGKLLRIPLQASGEWSSELVRLALRKVDVDADYDQAIPFGDQQPLGGILTNAEASLEAEAVAAGCLIAQLSVAEAAQPVADRISPDREKLEAMAEFAAGAGHEINNPLATISGRVQMLLRKELDAKKRKSLEIIGGQALRIRDMIGDAMLFARPPLPTPQVLQVEPVISSLLDRFREAGEKLRLEMLFACDATHTCWADPLQFEIALSELLRNAIENSEAGGQILLRAERDGENWIEISVFDTGNGFTAEQARHAFDPFYSGRQAGRGLGFGLCKAWRIIEQHGGAIEVAADPAGTRFVIRWPTLPAVELLV